MIKAIDLFRTQFKGFKSDSCDNQRRLRLSMWCQSIQTNNFSRSWNTRNAENRVNKPSAFFPETVFKSHISSKERFMAETNIEFENVKLEHAYAQFKTKGLILLKKLHQGNNYVCKIDLKDSYFSVLLSPDFQKFINFKWKRQIYQFICLWHQHQGNLQN